MATFTRAEFAADFIILGLTFGHGKFVAQIITFSTAESATESTCFGNSFTFGESVIFDRLFSPIYFEVETIIFATFSAEGFFFTFSGVIEGRRY